MIWQEVYEQAQTFEEFLAGVSANRDLWLALAERASIPPELERRAGALTLRWKLLVVVEDWCGDAVNIVPVIARLAQRTPGLDLRIVGRDTHPAIMDSHLTGTSRSIPIVILLDEAFNERAWWGPLPAELQQWVLGDGRRMEKAQRYAEIRRWYARDRGKSTIHEILEKLVPTDAAAA